MLDGIVHQREPGLPITAVKDQRDGFADLPVYQQYHHLTVALICAVMRTRAILKPKACIMQVEGP